MDALYRPVAGKPFVLEDLCLGMGTSVACALTAGQLGYMPQKCPCPSTNLTAETIFEIVKCISDVDMPARVRMGSKSEICRFFNSGYAHDRNILICRRRAFLRTGNTLIKPNCASVRHSRDSLHRDRHKVTKKVAAAPCSETA